MNKIMRKFLASITVDTPSGQMRTGRSFLETDDGPITEETILHWEKFLEERFNSPAVCVLSFQELEG